MRGTILSAMVMTAIGAAGPVFAQSNCLPRAALQRQYSPYGPAFELGLVGGSVTLCTSTNPDSPRVAGCWTINPATGALTASRATMLPGRSQAVAVDATGCVAGYCPTPRADTSSIRLWATSTNGVRAVVLSGGDLHVFDVVSKAHLRAIPLIADDVPGNTIVGNAPVRLLYLDDTIHVVGADAGPFAAIWSFKDSGVRLGRLTKDGRPEGSSIDIYRGGASIIDDGHIAVADAALRRLVVLDTAGKRTTMVRQVSAAPCGEQDLIAAFIEDDTKGASAACRRVIATHFVPYYDVELVRLPSGTFLATLSGKHGGEIAVLDKTALREVGRLKLARCAR